MKFETIEEDTQINPGDRLVFISDLHKWQCRYLTVKHVDLPIIKTDHMELHEEDIMKVVKIIN